jgi:hypothetical protein
MRESSDEDAKIKSDNTQYGLEGWDPNLKKADSNQGRFVSTNKLFESNHASFDSNRGYFVSSRCLLRKR